MPNYKRDLVFAVFLSLAFLQSAKALKCYVCKSSVADECLDPFDEAMSTWEGECEEPMPFCVKYKFINSFPYYSEEIRRGCGGEEFCYTDVEAMHSEQCTMCRSNLCNSAAIRVPQLFTLILVTLITFYSNR